MTKLYKGVDKLDGKISGFLIHNGIVAISPWLCDDNEKIKLSKKLVDIYSYQNIESFENRAINPVLIAEW